MRLVHGMGNAKNGGCLMSVVGWLTGEEDWTDRPRCVCPVIREVGVLANDGFGDGIFATDYREKYLGPYVFRVMGTSGSRKDQDKRLRMVLAWMKVGLAAGCISSCPDTGDHGEYAQRIAFARAGAFDDDAGAQAGLATSHAMAAVGASRTPVRLVELLDLLCRVGERQEIPQARKLSECPAYAGVEA